MIKAWDEDAWIDYVYWQTEDKKTLKILVIVINIIFMIWIMGNVVYANTSNSRKRFININKL